MRITINLLKQTGGERDQALIEYMKAFEMSQFEREISVEIKLCHFLHFYETVEEHCAKDLMGKILPVYTEPVDTSGIRDVINRKFKDNEDEVMHVSRMMTRLCIRLFSINSQLGVHTLLFYVLFMDGNEFIMDADK